MLIVKPVKRTGVREQRRFAQARLMFEASIYHVRNGERPAVPLFPVQVPGPPCSRFPISCPEVPRPQAGFKSV